MRGVHCGRNVGKDQILRRSTLKTENLRVGYVYMEESFDTTFNMSYGGGAVKESFHSKTKSLHCNYQTASLRNKCLNKLNWLHSTIIILNIQ